jgi:hypothetical protein
MRSWSPLPFVLAVTLAGCPGGDGALGDTCAGHSDCSDELQCFAGTCQARCKRAPECGDGYRCASNGMCQAATGSPGDSCESEVDCSRGLSCQVQGTETRSDGYLLASCVAENAGRPAGATCVSDGDCRNGTCDLGHCADLCSDTRDCAAETSCTGIPRVASTGLMYRGCLPSGGTLTWQIPVQGTDDTVMLPIPESARGVSVLFTVEDQNQKVGTTLVTSPSGATLIDPSKYSYYLNPFVRHRPEYGQSVLAMPSTPTTPLEAGVYTVRVRSLRQGINSQGQPEDKTGTATPTMTAVVKLDSGVILDLHFHFLDLTDHPCAQAFAGKLDAAVAEDAEFFQSTFMTQLRTIFAQGGIALGETTYEDIKDHPDLDGLDIVNASSLAALGKHATGINVFFVRTLSPVGLQGIGPNPGPAGLANTRQSGIVVGVDTLCYRSWTQLARITAHEIALYMGLYNNIVVDHDKPDVSYEDWIPDSAPTETNLMFYSELGGTELSEGQRYILSRSSVLR